MDFHQVGVSLCECKRRLSIEKEPKWVPLCKVKKEKRMIYDFFNSLHCVLPEENADYQKLLHVWRYKKFHVALMPAITWYYGTCNLFDKKAGAEGKNLIWIIPAGQNDYYWLPQLKQRIVDFYDHDEIEIGSHSLFPEIEVEEFKECILLQSTDLQNDSERTILGANVIFVHLSLSSGSDTILAILLDHQDRCWKNIIERYNISLTWFVDSGRGTEDYYARVNLYQLMKQTQFPKLLPSLYFKGLYNKGEIPEGFRFLYAMISQPDANGYDKWRYFSGVYDTGWKHNMKRNKSI